MDTRKRALVGECISRASVDAARDMTLADLDAAIVACDYERAATIALARARAGDPVGADVIARILPGIELPALTCSLIAIAPARRELIGLLDERRFPTTKDAAELETLTLYATWKAGVEAARIIPHLRRLAARSLSAESYALLATIATTIDDPHVAVVIKPIAAFAKEYARHVAADDKAMHASLDAVLAELPAQVEASTAAGFTVRGAKQPGRNDACPCGSGNKYKKCCADKPQAAPSPIPGLTWDEFLAGDRITSEHIVDLPLRDVVRIDLTRVAEAPLRAILHRFVTANEWTHAERVRLESVRRGGELAIDLADELAEWLLMSGQVDAARAIVASLPADVQARFAIELESDPGARYAALVAQARANVASDDPLVDVDLAYTLLRAEPALGIIAARACIGSLRVDDADTLLDTVEEVRDQLNLPPNDPAWDVLDTLRAKSSSKPAKERATRDAELAEATAKADQLERTLAATRAELDAATTRPVAALVRAPEATSGIDARVRELEALIRAGNEERRELRRQLEQQAERRPEEAKKPATVAAEPDDEGLEEAAEGKTRRAVIPRFERRFVDALDDVPANVAAEAMRTIGALAAGDGHAWRTVKQAKDMARQVLMARVGIHHRLVMRGEEGDLEILDLITREQLDTTLRRLRMNR